MSYRDVEEWLPWDEYYILMSVALDLDELEQYWQYVLSGGDPKKWHWSSPDKAGLASRILSTDPESMARKTQMIMKKAAALISKGRARPEDMPKGGSLKDFLEITRQKLIRRLEYEDGRVEYVDEDGNPVEPPEGLKFMSLEED